MVIASFDRVTTVGRKPYRGSVSQIVEDVSALVQAGVDHVLFVTAHLASETTEYLDRIAELHTATRVAGLGSTTSGSLSGTREEPLSYEHTCQRSCGHSRRRADPCRDLQLDDLGESGSRD
ncbi:hypothetical protein AB0368_08905 [Actinoplanes sp. NPDC051475]|uniref:hypothetical protein n=1 Tax=Actinoplanes sp. NPDC051475 TaxID=3157225 RepID=UPI003450C52B